MKKSILLSFLLLSTICQSQITLDFQTVDNNNIYVKLSNTSTKYMSNDIVKIDAQNQIELFNLDGTQFKIIQLPARPDPSAYIHGIVGISNSLFDNDPSNIELMVVYYWDSIPVGLYSQVEVVREDGSILFSEFDADLTNFWPSDFGQAMIYSTEEGAKLRLQYYYANGSYYETRIFSLPGEIPSFVPEETNTGKNNLTVYPNPNNGTFFIKLQEKEGYENTIDFYTANGKLIDTFKSDNNQLHFSNYGLTDGLYLVKSHYNNKQSMTKMIIRK